MEYEILHSSIHKAAQYHFARSGGPGGQNVNKVNTKVFLSIDLALLEGLSASEYQRICTKLASKLDSLGLLTISVEEERSQYRNREIALQKIELMIVEANKQDKKRIPSKPGKAAKLRRLNSKKARSSIKAGRSTHYNED